MTVKEITLAMEELETKLWTLNSLTLAVHDAVVEGPNAASNFDGALHALTCMTFEVEQRAKKLTEELFKIIKAETKEVA